MKEGLPREDAVLLEYRKAKKRDNQMLNLRFPVSREYEAKSLVPRLNTSRKRVDLSLRMHVFVPFFVLFFVFIQEVRARNNAKKERKVDILENTCVSVK